MKARDPTQFRQAWQWHIDQLASLALAANVTYDQYVAVKRWLEDWLDDAHKQMINKGSDHE